MKKIDIVLLDKYINGEYIEEKLLEKLEDDSEFMKSVFFFSNDKNIYNLCSDKVKKDYSMVLFLVNKFNFDEYFMCNVVDYYLKNCNDETNRFELSIIMSEILNNDNKYSSIVNEKYYSIKKSKDKYLEKYPNSKRTIGCGFIFINKLYHSSNIVMDYCSKKYIEELVLSNDFETYIHNNFESYSDFEKNINTNIINYIDKYDHALSEYIKLNISCLYPIKKLLRSIENKWNKYDKKYEKRKYLILLDTLKYYMLSRGKSKIDNLLMIYYVSYEMGILKDVIKYIDNDYDYEEVINELDCNNIKSIIGRSIPDRIKYLGCKEIINNIIFKDNLNYEYNNESEIKTKSKIIDFNKVLSKS